MVLGPGCESPWRNTAPEENAKLFERMRKGFYAEGECSLRMKVRLLCSRFLCAVGSYG